MQKRAVEIAAGLLDAFTFTASQHVAVHEVAGLTAILEAIDRDLAERGVVGKKGEPNSLLAYRARISRQLERWLGQISSTIDRQTTPSPIDPVSEDDLVRELQRIALGLDVSATPGDRISAYRELSKLAPKSDAPSFVTIRVFHDDDDNRQIEYLDGETVAEA